MEIQYGPGKFKEQTTMLIQWFNANGSYSFPFNSEYFATDPLGYLDALRKGEEMLDVHVLDANGNDITSRVL